jgi:hypothetical protein
MKCSARLPERATYLFIRAFIRVSRPRHIPRSIHPGSYGNDNTFSPPSPPEVFNDPGKSGQDLAIRDKNPKDFL